MIVPRTIAPEEEKHAPTETLELEQEQSSKKYRIDLGWGVIVPFGDITQDVDGPGFAASFHAERMITTKAALGYNLSLIGFPTERATWSDLTVPPFTSTPIQLDTRIWQFGIHVKYFVSESPVGFYLFGGSTFNLQTVELFYLDDSQPDLYEKVDGVGLMVGGGFEYPISESFLLGFEYDYNKHSSSNYIIEKTLGWHMLYYSRGSLRLSYRL